LHGNKGSENLLAVEMNSIEGFLENEKLSAVFFINQGTIERASIIALSNHHQADQLIPLFFNSVIPKNYSGKISVYSILQNIEFFSVLDNGQLRENGNINGSKSVHEDGKTNGCIDWYLVTTYYYADGSRKTTDYFLFRTCDCEEQNSRMGRVSCGEGGTSGSTPGSGEPVFPANPHHGDEYEFRYPDGRKVFYVWNAYASNWDWVMWLVPEATVQSYPLSYPHLVTDGPTDGMKILGPDNLLYIFKGDTGNWISLACIQNQLTNPCLYGVADHVLSPDLANTYNDLIQDLFNSTETVNWILKEQSNISGSAVTDPPTVSGGILSIITTLDPTDLSGKSQEYIASTVYHEGFHAILFYFTGTDYTPTEQHYLMMTTYLDLIGVALQEAYPNITLIEAKGLILKEALNSKLSPTLRAEILSRIGLSEQDVTNIVTKFITNAPGSTPCN
jgi:hypothetical protein